MSKPEITAISPFFIVTDVDRSIAFYRDKLGFTVTFRQPDEGAFFAILARDGAQLFIKSESGIVPQPNPTRHGTSPGTPSSTRQTPTHSPQNSLPKAPSSPSPCKTLTTAFAASSSTTPTATPSSSRRPR